MSAASSNLVEFLAQLGEAMGAAGTSVGSTTTTLRTIAAAYGAVGAEVVVLPTLLLLRLHEHGTRTLELTSSVNRTLRLDQTDEVFRLVDRASVGGVEPDEGLAELHRIWAMPARIGAPLRAVGHAILAVGLGLILTPRPEALAYCAGLGLVVGALKLFGDRSRMLTTLMPVVAALVVGCIIFGQARQGLIVAPLLLLIPPLITFLPGGVLTTGMMELADGHTVSGASRLIAGATQLVLVVAGLSAAAQVIGLPPVEAFAERTDNLIGPWAPWLGVLVFGIGTYLHFVAPRGSLLWLCLVLYVAWIGQTAGNLVLGAYLGSFIGAMALTSVAYAARRRFNGPPIPVLFLPSFWLLVPGAIGVAGLSQLVSSDAAGALRDTQNMVFTIVSIAVGVVVGIGLGELLPARIIGPPVALPDAAPPESESVLH